MSVRVGAAAAASLVLIDKVLPSFGLRARMSVHELGKTRNKSRDLVDIVLKLASSERTYSARVVVLG